MDDLILEGKKSFWITEAGSHAEDGSFAAFTERIMDNPVSFDERKLRLRYVSMGREYALKYGKEFMLNGEVVDTEYSRYDAPYVKAEKKDETLTFSHAGRSLYLDFENLVRKF